MDINTTDFVVGGIIIFTGMVVFIVLFIFLYQKRYYRYLREKEQLKTKFSQELLKSQLEIQEQTMKNIAQEIHDNIGQELSLVKLNLNTMDPSKLQELEDKISTSKELVSKAIQDLRDLSRTLNTETISAMGLCRAIEYELDMISKTGVCKTNMDIEGEIKRLDVKKELILFRIVQETLHNIIKHAAAREINVSAHFNNSKMQLSIKDDGKGFDPASAFENISSTMGMGIRNMRNRAALIDAEFLIDSIKDKGTEIKLKLSLNL